MNETSPLTVTVTHDLICPWCLVAEARLARAIATLPDPGAVQVTYRPFELNPDMPPEGVDRRAYRSAKFGSWERSQALDAQTELAARRDGIRFDYARMERTPNTRLAHRLMVLAARRGRAGEVSDAVLRGYFERGLDIGRAEVLAHLAAEGGLDRVEAEAFLSGEDGLREVLEAEAAGLRAGIRSVPLIEIGAETVSGAQPEGAIRAALERALAEAKPVAGAAS